MHGHSTPSSRRHYQLLAIIVIAAIALRIWHLGTKPLWLDEVIGSIFTLGKGLDDIPLGTIFPLTELSQIFSLDSGLSCHHITQTVATESVHPPLFFCLQYAWLSHWLPFFSSFIPAFEDSGGWVWVLRSLPALAGMMGVLCIYGLGRMVMGPCTGLIAAALMAVSPFAVYLSQEARHYTLPMLWTILALMALVRIQQLILRQQALPSGLLVVWVGVNSLGLYTHYFFLLDFVAQLVAMGAWLVGELYLGHGKVVKEGKRFYRSLGQLGLSITVVLVSYAPWLPTLLQHITRPETDWLKPYKPDWGDRIAPLYQTLMGWILMVISLPVESQPLAIAIPSVLVMVLFGIWLSWQIFRGIKQAWRLERNRPAIKLFLLLMISLLIQVLAIVYILDKDITAIPRYNFISYPIVLILIAIGLTPQLPTSQPSHSPSLLPPAPLLPRFLAYSRLFPSPLTLTLLIGFFSALLAIHGLVFQKGYYPHRVAQDMTQVSDESLLVAVSYRSLQEVALGLSFALEIEKRYLTNEKVPNDGSDAAYMMFVDRSEGFGPAWRQLKHEPHSLPLPMNLWAIASPGMKTKDYPSTLTIRRPNRKAKVACNIDPDHFHRIGFPYQLFRCPE